MQLWVALPAKARDGKRRFDHHAPEPFSHSDVTLAVFLGTLAGATSPVRTFTPLLGAQLDLPVGAAVTLDVDPGFEHGVIVDKGLLEVGGSPVRERELAYQCTGSPVLSVRNAGSSAARAVLLGGEPFTEDLLMWWNFVGRTHEEIVEYRSQWEAESDRFGEVLGYRGTLRRIPAPPLPTTRLRARQPPTGKDPR
jgi:redox-sensitive bicupin YhaK (pirin superfamily)